MGPGRVGTRLPEVRRSDSYPVGGERRGAEPHIGGAAKLMAREEVPTEKLQEKAREAIGEEEMRYVLMDLVDAVGSLRQRVEELEEKEQLS